MSTSSDNALEQALAFHRTPELLIAARRKPLPADLRLVLRIAAGESEAVTQALLETGATPELLREAAIFYVQQMLISTDGDSYRVLGVNPDASDDQIKQHYRWLVHWLHPDRNPDEWESVFADRVNLAWQDLRTPSRRNAYDLKRDAESELTPNRSREDGSRFIRTAVPMPILSARTVRWLPTLVVGGFGLFAMVALGLLYKLQVMDHEANSSAARLVQADGVRTEPAFVPQAIDVAPSLVPVPSKLLIASTAPIPTPMPAPTPAPMPVSLKPTLAPIAASNAAMLASSEPNQIAKAAETSVTKPVPNNQTSPIRVVPTTKLQQPISGKAETRYLAAAAPVSSNVENSVPKFVDNGTVPEISNQASAPEPRIVENIATATAPPTRQDVSFQARQDSPRLIDDRIAASLVSRFSQAYANGDMDRLMQLFTHDAQNGRGDRRSIAEDYRLLFESSDRRRIAVSDMSWLTVGNGATIIASFETEVVPRGKVHGEHATGDIRFDLREEDGELRIYRLSHDNRRS